MAKRISDDSKKLMKGVRSIGRKSHTAIGEYIFTFEGVMESIRFVLQECLFKEGLDNENLIHVLLHNTTAQPLLKYLKGFIHELYPEQMADTKIESFMKAIWSDVQHAIDKRNEVAHSHYYYWFKEVKSRK